MASSTNLITAFEVRQACRRGELTGQTSGLAPGYAQANLVILPRDWAYDFLGFCRANPKPCPLLDVTEPGDPVPRHAAPQADLRTDLPKYRIWVDGVLTEEPTEIANHWRDDLVSFVIGCSFTFEEAMIRAGISVRHIELGCNVPMFRTNIPCQASGRFHGPLVVSMRPLSPGDAIRAVQVTSRYPSVHGAPVHLGFPEQIGIADIHKPDYGDAVPVKEHELPVFWACGVTPQAVLMAAKPPFAITHSPGCMFLTDLKEDALSVG